LCGLFIGTGFNGDIDGHRNNKSADDVGRLGGGYLGYIWQMEGANLGGGGFVLGAETDSAGWSADGGGKNNKNNKQ
jgi:hypothetical protein